MANMSIPLKWETRTCTVKNEPGYFHIWEHFSKPLEASPLMGGAPAGVFSKIFGIVEFADGVRRVDPTDICFCDEENAALCDIPWIKPVELICQHYHKKQPTLRNVCKEDSRESNF